MSEPNGVDRRVSLWPGQPDLRRGRVIEASLLLAGVVSDGVNTFDVDLTSSNEEGSANRSLAGTPSKLRGIGSMEADVQARPRKR